MPSVSYDSRSLLLGSARGRGLRFLVVAAAFDATLIDPDRWADTLQGLRHAGFNSIVVRVPWILHEPTPGRFDFRGARDIRRVITEAGVAGLKVMIRIGPCVGGSFADGGLPVWITSVVGDRVREANPGFLNRVTAYWRRLAAEFVDLQSTRNGNGALRPVIAVGIEDAWRCLDAELGQAYFAGLVRFAREVGIDVPLVTMNNCWYLHEGVIDAWQRADDVCAIAMELHLVQPEAPAMVTIEPSATNGNGTSFAAAIAEAIATRADCILEVLSTRHLGATSAVGGAQSNGTALYPMRRALAFASSFGEVLAELTHEVSHEQSALSTATGSKAQTRVMILKGASKERISVVVDRARMLPVVATRKKSAAAPTAKNGLAHRRADGSTQAIGERSARGVDFFASDILVAGARLERCSGSIVACAGDLLILAGKSRAKLLVKVDGSEAALTVAADGALPRVVKVRGLRFAAIPHELADGIAMVSGGFEFVDEAGALLATLTQDGTAKRYKLSTTTGSPRRNVVPLERAISIVETSLLDGTHARFASIAAPEPIGAYGLQTTNAYYRARFRTTGRTARTYAIAHACSVDGRIAVDGVRVKAATGPIFELAPSSGMRTLVAEVRHIGANTRSTPRVGVFGPLLELAPLQGVARAKAEVPPFDEAIGRFMRDYDTRGGVETLQWSFAARTGSVVMRVPPDVSLHHVRLNGALVGEVGGLGSDTELIYLDGALLQPTRRAPLKEGEKPPKAKNAKMVATHNEVLLDIEHALDTKELARWRDGVRFYEVRAEVAAEWAFARIERPASWVHQNPLPKKSTPSKSTRRVVNTPTWFRWAFRVNEVQRDSAQFELSVTHAAGSVATVLVNGERALVFDGVSGVPAGTAKKPMLHRSIVLPKSLLRAGENEICAFEPDGAMPELSVVHFGPLQG